MLALSDGKCTMLELLHQHVHSEVNVIDDNGRTALWWAAAGGCLDAVGTLTEDFKAMRHITDSFGKTPYAVAKERGYEVVTAYLRDLKG
jgi:ankyrin repeat protein